MNESIEKEVKKTSQKKDKNRDASQVDLDTDVPAPEEATEQGNEQIDPQAEIMKQLDAAQSQCEEYKDKYLLAVADLDNFRKRALREKEETRRLASAAIIEGLLPIMDNFSLGLAAAENQPKAKSITEGFSLVANQLNELLQQNGVQTIDPIGELFDPNCHECVAQQASETVDEDHIIAVNRKGYLLNQRLLRPAHVLVSSGPADQADTGEAEKEPSKKQNSEKPE